MLSLCATTALTSSMLFSSAVVAAAVTPAFEKAVTISGAIHPDAAQAGHFTITVQFEMGEGWHTYDDVGEGAEQPTSLKLKLPEGAKAVGGWKRPSGVDGKEAHSKVYFGRVEFTQTVAIEPGASVEDIDVVISYQACTDEYCNPPQTKTVSLEVPVADASGEGIFEAPVRLMVGDAPLNTAAKKRFPSPAIFDVDGDGQNELIIGELMGRIGVYENLNASGEGDPVWGKSQTLKGAGGEPIRTSNW